MEQHIIRILGIAPYEAMARMMENVAESFSNIAFDIFIGDLEEGAQIVRLHADEGYDCIVSRGGTAELIRQTTNIPVIEIQLSVYDVLRAIKLAENYSRLYAIVGFPSITESAHTLCDLLQYKIDIFTIHNEKEVRDTLERLQERGYKMVVSDMITHTAARQIGMDAFLITSGNDALLSAFEKAVSLGSYIQELRRENLFLRHINTIDDNRLIVLDEAGDVFYNAGTQTPDKDLLDLLRASIPNLSENVPVKFYDNDHGALFSISAKIQIQDNKKFFLFYCQKSQIPLRSYKNGIRHYNKNECMTLFLNSFYSISGSMGTLEAEVTNIAKTNQSVMIIGEVGTGKEQIAHAIYLRSNLSNKPFTIVNCSALDDKSWEFLLNSPSSPLSDSKCTVYFQYLEALNENRCLELVSLIRDTALIKRERLIFSCCCDRQNELPKSAKLFSTRLECLTIHLPALRTRSDEIPSLASLYIGNLNVEFGKQISGFDPHAIEQLQKYDWPNNNTQFRNVLTKLASVSDSAYINSSTVAEILATERLSARSSSGSTKAPASVPLTLAEITANAVGAALEANRGNQTAAAKQLGISRTTFWRYLHAIDPSAK